MRIQGFRGNCDSQASWGCAPALLNQIQVVFLETCEILRPSIPQTPFTSGRTGTASAFKRMPTLL